VANIRALCRRRSIALKTGVNGNLCLSLLTYRPKRSPKHESRESALNGGGLNLDLYRSRFLHP